MRYEVTRFPPDHDAETPVITDAAGVPELVREAAQSGRRVHIRPITNRAAPAPVHPHTREHTHP
ncbi:hypothetical protein GCM10009554_43920 [Kribbella koreensis]|uniref:DUF2188 domain-containing protein n=2 Tax=Kribbella TaxID=182639 RepID=A0ABP6VNU3_9ACTN